MDVVLVVVVILLIIVAMVVWLFLRSRARRGGVIATDPGKSTRRGADRGGAGS